MKKYSFLNGNRIHYPKHAWSMMHEATAGVYRFIGVDEIPQDKWEPLKDHIENVGARGYNIIRTAEDLTGLSDPKFTDDFTHGYTVHDHGEIVVEPMTSHGEMSPELNERLKQFSPTETETAISAHFYRYALTAAHMCQFSDFEKYVEYARKETVPQSHANGNMPAEDILSFYQNITDLMAKTEKEMAEKNHYWNCEVNNKAVNYMMHHYHDIEQKRSFAGTFGKTLEKMDGSAYLAKIVAETPEEKRVAINPLQAERMFRRYEGCFHTLLTQAKHNPLHIQLAKGLMLECIDTTLTYIDLVKEPLLVDGMPEKLAPEKVAAIYLEQKDIITAPDFIKTVTPEMFAPGQSLLYTHQKRVLAA